MGIKDTGIVSAREVLDVITVHGVRTLVLSPGSRNAPLLIGAAARENLKKYVINDERTAAFIALGIAIASRQPVGLVCTSGSALYNYAPAIAEAFYQHIPLIVISADRPTQWINQDSQTLKQNGALSDIVKESYDIPSQSNMNICTSNANYGSELQWYSNRIANDAMITALTGVKGPVHINIQFETPFNQTVEYKEETPRIIEFLCYDTPLPFNISRSISEFLLDKKILLFAGHMLSDHKLNKAVLEFSNLGNVSLLAEPISNLHLDYGECNLDILSLNELELSEDFTPDIIISIGGLPVSDGIKSYLRKCIKAEHWTLGDNKFSLDNYMVHTRHFDVSPATFFKNISSMTKYLLKKGAKISYSDFNIKWRKRIRIENEKINAKLQSSIWDEKNAVKMILNAIPNNCNLFISNGMNIRNTLSLIDRIPHNCWANRGVSGIEGTNATALGASLNYKGTTVLLTGDISFSYNPDIMNFNKLGGDLRIIVINNRGGDIFRKISSTRDLECREEFFCNDPEIPLGKLAQSYNWHYYNADSLESLARALQRFFINRNSIIEVKV